MHRELLSEFLDFFFILFQQNTRVELHLNGSFIRDFHHPGSELKGGDSLLQMDGFWPDIGYHDSFTVSSYRVFEKVSEFAGAVRDVVALVFAQRHHYLLQKGE